MSTALVEVETEVLDAGRESVSELASIANREHALAVAAAESIVLHAIAAGEALTEVHRRLGARKWSEWLKDSFTGSRALACVYMRIARHRDQISRDATSLSQAYNAVKGLPDIAPRALLANDDVIVNEAKALRSQGHSWAHIGRALGIHSSTARRYADPVARRRDNERARETVAARKALERDQAIKQAVRKAGAGLAEAYAMAERMQDVLAQAHREATDPEARAALSAAGEHHRRMRDRIVAALGVS